MGVQLRFFLDTFAKSGSKYWPSLVELPRRHWFKNCNTRTEFARFMGDNFVMYCAQAFNPATDLAYGHRRTDPVSVQPEDVIAMPRKTNFFSDIFISFWASTLLIWLFCPTMALSHKIILIGVSIIIGAGWGNARLIKQRRQANTFNRSKVIAPTVETVNQ